MNRYDFLIYLWELTDKHSHHITSEFLALTMADQYVLCGNEYSKDLAYVVTVIAAKINEEGGGLSDVGKLKLLEQKVCNAVQWNFRIPLFMQQISNITEKIYSDGFILLLRYLQWHDVNANLPTIILALTILRKQLPIFRLMKYIRIYNYIQDM